MGDVVIIDEKVLKCFESICVYYGEDIKIIKDFLGTIGEKN